MTGSKTYISFGDVIDLYYKIKEQGVSPLLSKLHLSNQARTVSKWNAAVPSADFWIIPEIRSRWNEKCTGNPDLEYEDYFVGKYLSGQEGLKMLSVGCGTGARDRKFGKYPHFRFIEGIDVADKLVNEARKHAASKGLNNLRYIAGDFEKQPWEVETYDVILFNSSLHHFAGIDNLLRDKVRPLLKQGGYLVIHEYVGPNRLQWTEEQLHIANQLLNELPDDYKIRFKSNAIKRRIYRPGLIRMLLSDPSEAIDSESIIPAVHKHFRIVEEKKLGWDITHLLFKDIAHNFLREDNDTKELLAYLFAREDEYMALTGRSDAIFGIYRKQGEAT